MSAYFATAPNWVATSSSGSFAVALDYARQRAKLYGRAEVWRFTPGRFESGAASLVLTVYAPPLPPAVRALFVAMSTPTGWGADVQQGSTWQDYSTSRPRACSCTGDHVAACRGWAT